MAAEQAASDANCASFMRCNKRADGFSANRPILPSSPGDSGRSSFHRAVSFVHAPGLARRLSKTCIYRRQTFTSRSLLRMKCRRPDWSPSRGPHFSWRNERRARCQLKAAMLRPLRRASWLNGFFANREFPSLRPCDCCLRIRNIYHSAQSDAMHRHMQRLRAHPVLKLELTRRKRARQSDPCIDVCGEANG